MLVKVVEVLGIVHKHVLCTEMHLCTCNQTFLRSDHDTLHIHCAHPIAYLPAMSCNKLGLTSNDNCGTKKSCINLNSTADELNDNHCCKAV